MPLSPPAVLVIMGVSGCGKTSVAEALAQTLHWPFQEGDALHPAANVAKMRAGTPLNDDDRRPWLDLVAGWIGEKLAASEHGIITCSALKRVYRERIAGGRPGVYFIYLRAARSVLEEHVRQRHHEFMPTTLLDSQLDTLEEPRPDEPVLTVEVTHTVEHTVESALRCLKAVDLT